MFHCSQLQYIYYRIKYRNRCSSEEPGDEENVKMLHDKYYNACILSMLECFLEAAPQLTIQVYILLQHRDDKTLLTGTTCCARHVMQVQLNIISMTAVIIKKHSEKSEKCYFLT